MKMSFFESIVLAGLLGCCSGARADNCEGPATRTTILPVQRTVEVKQVKGMVEYAYDGTGWRVLSPGKQLCAGATVRAAAGGAAILRVKERSSLVKVCSATTLHITSEAPAEELVAATLAVALPH